ncbi:hypothetical protein EV182_008673, partial [Spiromyces aspiralis]
KKGIKHNRPQTQKPTTNNNNDTTTQDKVVGASTLSSTASPDTQTSIPHPVGAIPKRTHQPEGSPGGDDE